MSAGQGQTPNTFGTLLRRHRQALGLSQEELADRAGLSVRAIANMERGTTSRPRRYSVQSIGDALGLPEPERRQLDQAARVLAGKLIQLPTTGAPQLPVPRQLPVSVAGFIGRTRELQELTELLDSATDKTSNTVVISAIGGTPGVGKTALAVHWAHQVVARFPDGQLYINLRGYDPGQPMLASNALAAFLRALGVPGHDIPADQDERAARYRSLLADRRMLIVLDNALDDCQVRPLLPGGPGSLVVLTSRSQLAGLVAAEGAHPVTLDVLSETDAHLLLAQRIGYKRVSAERDAAAELTTLCARLPLAVAIVAARASLRPGLDLAALASELRDARSRLDGLDAGDAASSVRAAFSWSFRQLTDDAARTFGLLGLHPGLDLEVHAAAALTGTDTVQARRMLGLLHRASLVQESGPGRYGMHDLLRAYAREQAADWDTDGLCNQALTQLFDYYLASAAGAMDVLVPAEAHRWRRFAPAAAVAPAMPSEAEAREWLDAERANLVAVVAHCAGHGWPRHATGLATTLFRYLMTGSHLSEAYTIYSHALQAASFSGDLAAEAEAMNGLGSIEMMKGHFRDAAGHYSAVLECYRRQGSRDGEGRVLLNLGITELQLHNFPSAAGYYREALAAFEDTGNALGVAHTLAYLAAAETELGYYDAAAEHWQLALPVLREAKDEQREAETLEGIGELSLRRGELTQAAAFFEQALTIFRRIDHRTGVAAGLRNLGIVCLHQCEHQQAIGYLRPALALFRESGNQFGETVTLRILAEALRGAGQPAAARTELAEALRLAAETGNAYEQASVHRDLAEIHHHAGEGEQAQHHWQRALTLYRQLSAPEADQVWSRLCAQRQHAHH